MKKTRVLGNVADDFPLKESDGAPGRRGKRRRSFDCGSDHFSVIVTSWLAFAQDDRILR
jgi:hypothetical protein